MIRSVILLTLSSVLLVYSQPDETQCDNNGAYDTTQGTCTCGGVQLNFNNLLCGDGFNQNSCQASWTNGRQQEQFFIMGSGGSGIPVNQLPASCSDLPSGLAMVQYYPYPGNQACYPAADLSGTIATYTAGSDGKPSSVTLTFAEHDDGTAVRDGYIKITCGSQTSRFTTVGDTNEPSKYEVEVTAPCETFPPATVTLSNGVEMPIIAMGTASEGDEASADVQLALEKGFRHIDAAHDYGDVVGVGQGIVTWSKTHSRSDVFVTTKIPGCGVPTQGLMPPCYENSIKLATSDISELSGKVDLLLIHFPSLEGCRLNSNGCKKLQQQWTALEELYNHNLTRAIGVSNMCPKCLDCIIANATIKPMVNQVQYHIGQGPDPGGLISYCAKHNIVIEAYSPLAHGKLLKDSNFNAIATNLTQKYGWNSSAQVALGWIAQQGHALVTKTTSPNYIAEDLDLFATRHRMSQNDIGALSDLRTPRCAPEAPYGCCK